MKKISCIYATARPSDCMTKRKEDDHITLFLDSLTKQTMSSTEIEVMIADCYYSKRQEHIENDTYKGIKYPFKIYHWQVKSPWLNKGMWTGQAPWNQGIMLSDAELIVNFGDCCELSPEYLTRMWDWHKKGYFPMGLVIYKIGNKLALVDKVADDGWSNHFVENVQELVNKKWDLSPVIRDSRWAFVEKSPNGIFIPKGFHAGQSFHGYSAVPLDVLLKINGFDENFDGNKALGDCDTGCRLLNAGYKDKVVIDKNIWIFENGHDAIPESILWSKLAYPNRSNYSLMMLNYEKKIFRANDYVIDKKKDIDWMYNYGKKYERWGDVDMRKIPEFTWWIEHQPNFDLIKLRNEVQENLKKGIFEIPDYYKDN